MLFTGRDDSPALSYEHQQIAAMEGIKERGQYMGNRAKDWVGRKRETPARREHSLPEAPLPLRRQPEGCLITFCVWWGTWDPSLRLRVHAGVYWAVPRGTSACGQ